MALTVFNTLTKQLEAFVPKDPPIVRIYTCGLTVYAPMHIGHARTYCFWDLFRRYLEYRGYHVISVINYTDIDDRIMAKAGGAKGSLDVAEANIATFRRDCRALKIRDYAIYTRATDFVAGQVEAVKALIEKGHAYVVDGEVFYSVESLPGYGKLSGRALEDQLVGASGRVEEDFARKRHPADFTLWKPSDADQPSWPTGVEGWPAGRPGWHIECSVMSTSALGPHFDVHGGGIDNLFPHHENEIAQSEPLYGAPWVRYWMHPEHLDLRGEKMSKSLGNVIGIPDLLAQFRADEVRWFYGSTHYRTKLPFSAELVSAAAEGYKKIRRLVDTLTERLEARGELPAFPPGDYASQRGPGEAVPRLRHRFETGRFGAITREFIARFVDRMDADLGTPEAAAALFDYVNKLYAAGIETEGDPLSLLAVHQTLAQHLWVFGIELPNERLFPELAADCFPTGGAETVRPYAKIFDRLLELRAEARKAKDFAKADLIRSVLTEAGLEVQDTPKGARWRVG